MRSALLCCLLVLTLPTAVQAHSGHGDEFVQSGEVSQVEANRDTDSLLGIKTAQPVVDDDGLLTIPSSAVVDASGQSLVFVHSGSTYDPVPVQTGQAIQGRITILDGVTPGEKVVVAGALSLYAESQKNIKKSPVASSKNSTAPEAVDPAKNSDKSEVVAMADDRPWRLIAAVVAVLVIAGAAVFGLSRGGGAGKS